MKSNILIKTLLVFSLFALMGCGGNEEETNSVSSDATTSSASLELKVTPSKVSSSSASVAVGQNGPAELTSLKYFIRSIAICQSLTPAGSGYLADDALADSTNYVDLLTAEGRAALNTSITLTDADVGKYKWGMIDWYRPIKFTGSVTLNNGTTLYTKAGTTALETTDTYLTTATDLTTGPAEETIVVLNNGGNWFRFATAFEITQQDIVDQTSFTLNLVFNPTGIIKGYQSSSRTGLGLKDSAGYVLNMPMLDLAPVVRASTDTVMKESYLLDYTGSTITPMQVRLELYYLLSDATKSIYGVDGKYLYNSTSTGELGDFYKTSSVSEATDGTLSFADWSGVAFLQDFTRLTNVGDTGTANLNCGASYGYDVCTSGTLPVTTTLTGVLQVD